MNTEKKQPKISIIMPIYNAEEYIECCLNSILKQTIKEIEVVCIDDCSSDDSLIILRKIAEKDNRVIIFENKENKGQGYSRNKALKYIQGEYVYTMDADDYLLKEDALQLMYDYSKKNNLDMLVISSKSKNESDEFAYHEIDFAKKNKYPEIMTGVESYFELINNGEYASPTWLYLYSKDFLKNNNLSFVEKIATEDISFTFDAHACASRVSVIPDILHCYRVHGNSQAHSTQGIYKTSSVGKNIQHLFEILDKDFFCENKDRMFEHELQQELLLWEKRFNQLSQEEKYNYINSIESNTIKELFRRFVLRERIFCFPEQVLQKLKKHKIYLYGAGDYARKVIISLDYLNINISGIIVTKLSKTSILGYEIIEYNNSLIEKEALIIVGVTEKYKKEIITILEKDSMNYLDISKYQV